MNWTPDLSPHYLFALMGPLAETLEMAAGAMLIATLLGMVLSIWITARLPAARFLYGLLAALRSIPDLTLAIFCVIIAGIGPGAGLLAVAIFYNSAMGKVFADLLRAADPGPVEALRATGAPSIVVVVFAHLQLRLQDLMTYGRYEFECAVRTSVIVGAVGGGGLGAEIAGSINAFDFRRTATLVLVLIAVMIGMERLLRYGRVAWILAVTGILSIGTAWTERLHLGHAWATFGSMLPPRLPEGALGLIPRLLAETLLMAVAGTLIGALVALPLGLCSSRRFAPRWLAFPVRRFLEILRAVPEVVWGLILITAAGVGPMAGAAALAIHSAGCLGRLFAESFDNVAEEPVAALAATGAPPVAVAAFGYVPLALPAITIHTLFRLEWNVRAAAVIGMIGAGGIGGALFNSQQLFFYHETMAWILVTWGLVAVVDFAGSRVRRRLGEA